MSNRRVREAKHAIARGHALATTALDAEAVARELAALSRKNSGLTPEDVVDAASDPCSAMHDAFHWDDTEAAHRWRLHQARGLIRSISVVCDGAPPRAIYVHVGGEDGYQPLAKVVKDVGMFARVLKEAQSRIEQAQASMDAVREAAAGKEDDTLAKITMAVTALETARHVAMSMH